MKQQDIDPRLVLDTTPVLIFSARPDGYIDYFNQRCLDYLGVPLDAIEGGGGRLRMYPPRRSGGASAALAYVDRQRRAGRIPGSRPQGERRVPVDAASHRAAAG